MNTWNLSDIAQAVNGQLINIPEAGLEVSAVGTDSRKLDKNALFVPIIAERNGHDFIESAIENGAIASLWSDEVEKAPKDFPLIVVEDTEKAYLEFGQMHLEQVNPRVIGITGSNGKTTTKDMTAAIIGQKYQTHKTAGNENNELGVPKTLLAMPATTEVLVLEMGMDKPGEIAVLSKAAKPETVAITMIGESHLQAFGSREKLALEKLDILQGLQEGGLFVRPAAEEFITNQFDHTLRNQSIGWEDSADFYATDVKGDAKSSTFTVHVKGQPDLAEEITIPVPGQYNVQNALIAIAIGLEFDVDMADIKEGLANMQLTKSRLEWLDGKNDTQLLNDAYNASPSSMKAVLNYFSTIELEGEKIIVLGDIRELGEASQQFHEDISHEIDLETYKAVLLYGEEMAALYAKLAARENTEHVQHFTGEKDALIEAIEAVAAPGDSILFKSSNGTDLLSVVKELKKD